MPVVAPPNPEARRIVKTVTDLEERIKRMERGLQTGQLSNSSMHGGVDVYDPGGTLRGRVGLQPDGTNAYVSVNPDPPPVPAAPIITPAKASLIVKHTGESQDGTGFRADFSHLNVYTADAGLPEVRTLRATLSPLPGETVVADLDYTQYLVTVTAVNLGGKESAHSQPSSGTPIQVVSQDLINGIVQEIHLNNDIVGTAVIKANAVTATLIGNDAIETRHLIASAVTSAEIATGAVNADKIVANAITSDKINALAITSDKIAANAIDAGKIAAGSITAVKLAATIVLSTTIIAGTGTVGARVQIDSAGIRAFNSAGTQTFLVSGTNGSVEMLGKLIAGTSLNSGNRIVVDPQAIPDSVISGTILPSILFYATGGLYGPAQIYADPDSQNETRLIMQSSRDRATADWLNTRLELGANGANLGVYEQNLNRRGGQTDWGLTNLSHSVVHPTDGVRTSLLFTQDYIQNQVFAPGTGTYASRLFQSPDAFDLGVFVGGTQAGLRDGGYLLLGRGTSDTWYGHSRNGTSISANIKFIGTSGEIQLNGNDTFGVNANCKIRADYFISGSAANLAALNGDNGGNDLYLGWNGTQAQILRVINNSVVKTFVIDHPSPAKKDKTYLVHAAIEGPEAAVIYRGTAEVEDGTEVIVLPDYFEDLVEEEGRTVHLTPVWYDGERGKPKRKSKKFVNPKYQVQSPEYAIPNLAATYPKNGRFRIMAMGDCPETIEVHWTVMGVRKDAPALEVEVAKDSVTLHGAGTPYTWIGK